MRYKLKNVGKSRPKALFGVDGAINAAATLAAAAMTTAATIKAANQQAKAVESSARTQADAIKAQTDNNTSLQKETMSFQRQINQENRQQQKDIQTTLQLMSGQQNMNDRLKSTQEGAKYGGRPKRKKLSKMTSDTLSYGGATKASSLVGIYFKNYMADTFKFPNGGYDVTVLKRQDILDCIDANIIDKEVALAIVDQCELDAAEFTDNLIIKNGGDTFGYKVTLWY